MIEIICDKGHKYNTYPSHIKLGRGCPYCSGQRVCDENSFIKNHPEVAKKWDYSKNSLNPETLTKGSNRKAWWICDKGHSFECHVVRMVQGSGCPYCYGRKSSPENNVLSRFPDIAKEWDFNKNIKLPEDYSATSRETVWWKCQVCSNSWEARIDSRTHAKNGCPFCAGRNATEVDNLLVKYPLISKEWDYDKNGTRPEEYRSHSEKKAWWKCLVCGNGWKTTIAHRVEGTGCPNCTKIILNDGEAFVSVDEALRGSHELLPYENLIGSNTNNHYVSSNKYFVVTDTSVTFCWQGNNKEVFFSSLPINKIRFKYLAAGETPCIKFRWNPTVGTRQGDMVAAMDAVIYAEIYVKDSRKLEKD